MSKNLKLKKVIKSLVPEPISSVFEFLYALWTFYERMYISRILVVFLDLVYYTLLYKKYISHTLFSKGWCLLCVRDEFETETDCYIDPKFFFILAGVAQPWVTEDPKPSVSNWLEPPRAPGYIIF